METIRFFWRALAGRLVTMSMASLRLIFGLPQIDPKAAHHFLQKRSMTTIASFSNALCSLPLRQFESIEKALQQNVTPVRPSDAVHSFEATSGSNA